MSSFFGFCKNFISSFLTFISLICNFYFSYTTYTIHIQQNRDVYLHQKSFVGFLYSVLFNVWFWHNLCDFLLLHSTDFNITVNPPNSQIPSYTLSSMFYSSILDSNSLTWKISLWICCFFLINGSSITNWGNNLWIRELGGERLVYSKLFRRFPIHGAEVQ